MNDILAYIAFFCVFVAIFLRFNPKIIDRLLSYSSTRTHPPLGQKWWVLHPNGGKSTVDYMEYNSNGKLMWKFHQYEFPIHAEMKQDMYADEGAIHGNGYFYCRFNANGTTSKWSNPRFRAHFDIYDKIKEIKEKEEDTEVKDKNIELINDRELGRIVSDAVDEDYADSLFGFEKKYFEYLSKKSGKALKVPTVEKGSEEIAESKE